MFETERLVLRGPEEETDLVPLLNALNDLENRVFLGRAPLVPESKDTVKKRHFDTSKPAVLPAFTFCLKPTEPPSDTDGKKPLPPIGMIFLVDRYWDIKNRSAMLGLLIFDAKNKGQGYGREVLIWMLEYAFMELGVHRVELQVYSFNERAIKLYRSVGFADEGRKRKCYFKTGVWHDELLMAVLDEDWLELRKKLDIRVLPPHLR